jgi:hypothetical protein
MGNSHGWRNLVGLTEQHLYERWRKKLDEGRVFYQTSQVHLHFVDAPAGNACAMVPFVVLVNLTRRPEAKKSVAPKGI